ncbi:MAG: DASS family sodium-coupled anion symporter, partial [bacterium]
SSGFPRVTLMRYTFMIVLFFLAGVVGFGPAYAGLSVEGQKCLGLFLLCVGLWVSHVVPLHITSMLVMVLLPVTGIMDSRKAFGMFGNEAMFFILGAFILSSIMIECGLSIRISLWVFDKFGRSPRTLRASVFLLCAFMSFWMSEHAVAAMAFPIMLEIVHSLKLEPLKSPYAGSMFLAMSYGCIIGGIATFLGGARAPLALGILLENTGERIGFFEWLIADIPLVLALMVVGLVVLEIFYKPEIKDVKKAHDIIHKKVLKLGEVSGREYAIGTVMLLTIISWIFLRNYIGLASAALLAVSLLFIFNLVKWRDVEHGIDWSIIIMYGGAIALGSALHQTGAATWLVESLIGGHTFSAIAVIAAGGAIATLLTESISNTAVVAVLLPVGLNMAPDLGIDPKIMTYAITLPAGLAFMMPMATPAIAIAFSSGYINRMQMFKTGIIMNVLAWILFVLTAYFYWPLLGY